MSEDKETEIPTSSSTQEVDYQPKPKRRRNKPLRFKIPFEKTEQRNTKALSKELKSWNDGSLSQWSELLQWKWDATHEDIATAIRSDESSVKKLHTLIMENKWNDIVPFNGVGSGILINKEDNEVISTEKPLDFWHQLSGMLTPDSLNNSSELSSVMKGIAENSPAEYAPIYEYLAIVMDDPASAIHMNVRLTGLQAGIVLEILRDIATSVKDTSSSQALLRKRAVAAVKGDWETLKMPVRGDTDASLTPNLKKRVSLQCLNPFGMPKDALPPVSSGPPGDALAKRLTIPTATPMPVSLRTTDTCQFLSGYKTMDFVHEVPRI